MRTQDTVATQDTSHTHTRRSSSLFLQTLQTGLLFSMSKSQIHTFCPQTISNDLHAERRPGGSSTHQVPQRLKSKPQQIRSRGFQSPASSLRRPAKEPLKPVSGAPARKGPRSGAAGHTGDMTARGDSRGSQTKGRLGVDRTVRWGDDTGTG